MEKYRTVLTELKREDEMVERPLYTSYTTGRASHCSVFTSTSIRFSSFNASSKRSSPSAHIHTDDHFNHKNRRKREPRAIKPLVRALSTGTATAKENAACALLRLSQVEENKAAIGRSGAIPPLVSLLASGGFRAKKDASTVLYSLCTVKENKLRAVKAGIMKVLVSVPEARAALVEEGGVPVPRDRVVNKEPSSASNHTRVSGTSYEDKALNKSNHSSNGVASAPKVSGGSPRENLSSPVKGEGVVHSNYTASLVKKKKNGNKEMDSGVEDEKIEALIKCDFFDREWIKDDSYPLYAPGSCNLIDEQFSCIQNERPDKDYQKYKWKPKGSHIISPLTPFSSI
ncbi:hypothetical protein VIGAN_09171600 [Vigna angularis var. angularis]|uniref:Trichome birefringence-like N-terminal domain-containing protein n=1 Tax=Vigna angularis var. angularis TaxID=157739 RepID=A0A0S3SZH0_PHAAN|nr:hypothetical protein VIGAN_09171600 [Vigna angularis var. angularis]